jgi:hypothetical protein
MSLQKSFLELFSNMRVKVTQQSDGHIWAAVSQPDHVFHCFDVDFDVVHVVLQLRDFPRHVVKLGVDVCLQVPHLLQQ